MDSGLIICGLRYWRCSLMLILVMLSGCGKDSPAEPATQVPALINLSSYDVALTTLGQTIRITATVADQDSRVITGAKVTWTSRNTNVATVDPGGIVTAVSNGATQITATFGHASASATVAVAQEPASVAILPESARLSTVGETVQLEAVVYDSGDAAIPGEAVSWSSSEPAVATVDANGLVTAVSRGTTQVKATSGNASMLAPVSVVFVREAFSITLNISAATLTEVGQGLQLVALVYDADGAAIPDAPVSWSSSEPAVAAVDDNGLVTAVFNGTTRITATSGGVNQFARISVDVSGTGPRPSADREALISLYNETGGPDWTNRSNWVSNAPVGVWHGVTTDADGRVVELRLRNNNLVGTIPAELGQLVNLRSMDLGDNQLTGSLRPELGRLIRLNTMLLDGNRLSGTIPAALADMINLETWDMRANRVSGSIPGELGQLRNLKTMDFGENDLTGGLPAELGRLSGLESIRLDNNRLTGSIPPELGQWARLAHLALHRNQLTGGIPPELGQLESVVRFELQFNQLAGGVPAELGNLAGMRSLDIRDNRDLTGPLPASLTNVNLSRLSLDNTQLCVPAEAAFRTWLSGIASISGIKECAS